MDISNFNKLSKEKKNIVINAGFKCFGQSGYEKTSVSEIAKEAGISKASIFHYFGTKKDMYLYLFEYAYSEIMKEDVMISDDFFDCLQLAFKKRMKLEDKHRGLYDFLQLFFESQEKESVKEIKEIEKKKQSDCLKMTQESIDWSRLRCGIEPDKVKDIASWITSGIMKQYKNDLSHEEIYQKIEEYIEVLRNMTYRKEYL